MWGVAKIFTSGHSIGGFGQGGFDRTPRTPLATGMQLRFCIVQLMTVNRIKYLSHYCK